jgi:hypothetical protein
VADVAGSCPLSPFADLLSTGLRVNVCHWDSSAIGGETTLVRSSVRYVRDSP